MRHKILAFAASAFLLTSLAATGAAIAETPGVKAEQKAAREKNPVVSDKIISKYEAKDARKQAHRAHKKARLAAHKARIVAKDAKKAEDAPH